MADEQQAQAEQMWQQMPIHRRHQLLGEVLSLLLASPLHRGYAINDVGSVFLPPINLSQFRIYRVDDRPVALVTWAWLDSLVEQRYVAGDYHLRPQDWQSGDQGWIIDFMAPYGHAKQIVHDLKHNIFPNEVGKAIRINADGEAQGIWTFHGIHRIDDAKGIAEGLMLPNPNTS